MRIRYAMLLVLVGLLTAQAQDPGSEMRKLPVQEPTPPRETFPATIPLVHLRPSGDPFITPQAVAPVYGAIHCDQDGGVFLAIADDLKHPLSGPIVRLSRGSRSGVRFDLHRVPGFAGRDLHFTQFSVAPGGEVYVIVTLSVSSENDPEAQYLVAFSGDGTYRWKAKFDSGFDTLRFLALPSGDFLVSGLELPSSKESAGQRRKAFTAIVDSDAKIKRQLSSQEEREGYEIDAEVHTVRNPVVTFSDSQMGPDGYIYVLKPAPLPVVEVLSQAGTKVRELRLISPIDGAQPWDLKVTQGSISLTFQGPRELVPGSGARKSKVEFVTFNSMSGEPILRYESSAIKGMLGCYERDRFTFVVPQGTNFALVTADTHP
jgi:hypothetical protein